MVLPKLRNSRNLCSQMQILKRLLSCYFLIIQLMIKQGSEYSTSIINCGSELENLPSLLPPIFSERNQIGRIEVGKQGVSAFPSRHSSFWLLVPICLWQCCRQPHIIYFLCCVVLQYFKYCKLVGEILDASLELFILVIVISLDIYARCVTYQEYLSKDSESSDSYYQVWSRSVKQWEQVKCNELKTGQIIKIHKYQEDNLRLNPVNLLPMVFASGQRNIFIKTTRIDKREEYSKIKILKPFRKLVSKLNQEDIQFSDQLFDVTLDYHFRSSMGSTFEAELSWNQQSFKRLISNQDIIPRGIAICTEDYVIGLILMPTDDFRIKNISTIYSKSNQINSILCKYLIFVIVMNIFLLGLLYLANVLLTEIDTQFVLHDLDQYSLYFVISLASNLCNMFYISIYLMINIHRIFDAWTVKKQLKMNMKNRVRSIDEFAQTDTLIMDDYFFLQNPVNEDYFQYAINKDTSLSQEHLSLILKVIDQSPLMKQHMFGHVMPIIKYFRFKKLPSPPFCSKIKILKERVVDDSCVEIKILVTTNDEENKFSLRFNDKPVASTLLKLRQYDFKHSVQRMVLEGKEINSLILFIEIMKIEKQCLESSNQYYQLYGLMTFQFDINRTSLQLIKDETIIKKYHVVFMTNKTWKYINYFMKQGGMKDEDTIQITLEEKEEREMTYIIKNHIKTLSNQQANNKVRKKAILLLDSSMITHLSHHSIRHLLCRLSKFCRYMVFYNCSQYQKQLCAANLFKIFPQHIFMSNYICDYNIFQWSNLSICEHGASSEMLTTAVVNDYRDLKVLIFSQAIKSIQIVYCIISGHNFKNQLFVISRILAFFLVFQGNTVDVGDSYSSELYFYYNFVFTSIPITFMIFKRPEVYVDEEVIQYLNLVDMIFLSVKTILLAGMMTCMIFALLSEQFVLNTFTGVLINCVVTGNIFLLFLDDSYNKSGQVVTVIFQTIFSLVLIIIVELFDSTHFLFVELGTNFDDQNKMFYLTILLIVPGISLLVLFAFSVGREIKITDNLIEIQSQKDDDSKTQTLDLMSEESTNEIILKVNKSKGKHMTFHDDD